MLLCLSSFVLLVGAAFFAGTVDAIGGGGGLVTVPVLLALGLEPHAVLATNKGQASFGAISSLVTYFRSDGLDRSRVPWGLVSGFAGSLLGAELVSLIPSAPLRPLVSVMLVAAACVMLLRDRLIRGRGSSPNYPWRIGALGLALGGYDGFFGPGTGTLLIAAFVQFFGDSPTRASGNAKVINFASNVAALIVFQLRGSVLWQLALPMGLANLVGANLGARLALRYGDPAVRLVALVVAIAVAVKVLSEMAR